MAANKQQSSGSLRALIEREKLNGTNFLDWDRNLRIVLTQERKEYVLDKAIPAQPETGATRAVTNEYNKHVEDAIDAACIMMACMEPDLQKQFVHLTKDANAIMVQLKEMYQEQAKTERFRAVKAFHSARMIPGESVSRFVLRMKGHLDHLERLGHKIEKDLAVNLIMSCLPSMYDQFIMNYNMHNMDKTVTELHLMLQSAETNLKGKTKEVLMVNKSGIKFKKPGQGKKPMPGAVVGKGRVPRSIQLNLR